MQVPTWFLNWLLQVCASGAIVMVIVQIAKKAFPTFDASPKFLKVLGGLCLTWAVTMGSSMVTPPIVFFSTWLGAWGAAVGTHTIWSMIVEAIGALGVPPIKPNPHG